MKRIVTLLALALVLAQGTFAASFSEPLIVTSAGQSNDLLIARQIFIRAGLEDPQLDALLLPDSLGALQTLVLVVGGSSKGLGQAQGAADEELTRVETLLTAAKEQQIRILCMHLGREARRGPLSDRFILPVLPHVEHLIVLEGGNTDSLFNKASEEFSFPLVEPHDYKAAVDEVNALFGWELP